MEMSACDGVGAGSVTECCNASRAGGLAALPRPSRPDLAGADVCGHVGVKKMDNGRLVFLEGFSHHRRSFVLSAAGSWRGGAYFKDRLCIFICFRI